MKNVNDQPLPDPDPYLSTRQVSKLLGVSPETVIRWILHAGLPATRLPSGRYRVRRSDALARLKPAEPAKDLSAAVKPPPSPRLPEHVREGLRRAGLLKYCQGEEGR